ncbi:hypothetical protein [Variovorax sp. RA8]|uniref:hypothetical protein n=1 Tax=Variovorax sp. (strain JCM 16519 / RA8) TaxID=662548 RepID=UPI0013A5A4E2|nr:hypothetical protein [Variovorax sp. RA8]
MTTHAATSAQNTAPSRTGDAGAAAKQPVVVRSARGTPWDWLFPGFFLCMVVAVLPLIGLPWTDPGGAAAWRALAATMLLSLPVFVPLPFLLVGCMLALAVQPATRTPAAFGFLGIGVLVAAAGIQALLAIR